MPGNFLLDTNIVIALIARESAVRAGLANAGLVFLPTIVLGELYYGAWKSTHIESNIAKIDQLSMRFGILECDVSTARCYGRTKERLRSRGRPIPDNDIWIASLAEQYDLTLVTRDRHFGEVEGIAIERW